MHTYKGVYVAGGICNEVSGAVGKCVMLLLSTQETRRLTSTAHFAWDNTAEKRGIMRMGVIIWQNVRLVEINVPCSTVLYSKVLYTSHVFK